MIEVGYLYQHASTLTKKTPKSIINPSFRDFDFIKLPEASLGSSFLPYLLFWFKRERRGVCMISVKDGAVALYLAGRSFGTREEQTRVCGCRRAPTVNAEAF